MPVHQSGGSPTVVLLSGGLDSAVLLADEARSGPVIPVYVATGLAWEGLERQAIERFLAELRPDSSSVRPLTVLTVDMTDLYAVGHWAVEGRPPGYHTNDADVYLLGRNIVLFGKAGVYCAMVRAARLVIGTLDHNPFPDATPGFRAAMASALSLGLAHEIRIDAPYASHSKAAVIRRGAALGVPLALTLSCMSPRATAAGTGFPRHCGVCSKCRERHEAFVEAAVADDTDYVDRRYMDG